MLRSLHRIGRDLGLGFFNNVLASMARILCLWLSVKVAFIDVMFRGLLTYGFVWIQKKRETQLFPAT